MYPPVVTPLEWSSMTASQNACNGSRSSGRLRSKKRRRKLSSVFSASDDEPLSVLVHVASRVQCMDSLKCCAPSCILPSSCRGRHQLWRAMSTACDLVHIAPSERWDEITDETGAAIPQHGAFMSAPELFDETLFNISPAEAAVVDPQHRLLLEAGYTALHAGGLRRASLLGSRTA